MADTAEQDYWTKTLANVNAGLRTDFTRKGSGAIPTFDAWMSQQGNRYDPANFTTRTSYSDESWGEQVRALSDLGRQRGLTGLGNAAEYDYLSQFYNVPSYSRSFLEGIAPIAAAAALPVAGAAGWLGGGATGAAAAPTAALPSAGTTLAGGIGGTGALGTGALTMGPMSIPTGVDLATAGAAAGGAGSLINGIPNNVLAGVLQGGLGYLGANKVSDAYSNVANQNLAIGAPYRDRLNASYAPNFDLWSQPGYAGALERAGEIAARQVSANRGNPYGNPTAMAEIQNDIFAQNYLPALANYRGQLGQFSGLGLNTAGLAQLGGAQNAGGGYDALGYAAGTIFNPQPNLMDIVGILGNNRPNYNFMIGGMPVGG